MSLRFDVIFIYTSQVRGNGMQIAPKQLLLDL